MIDNKNNKYPSKSLDHHHKNILYILYIIYDF